MQMRTAIMKKTIEDPQISKNGANWSSNLNTVYIPKGNDINMSGRHLNFQVYWSTTHIEFEQKSSYRDWGG
jgi:hypothetical protein